MKSSGKTLSGSTTVRSVTAIEICVSSSVVSCLCPVIAGGSLTATTVTSRSKGSLSSVPSLTVTGTVKSPKKSAPGMRTPPSTA